MVLQGNTHPAQLKDSVTSQYHLFMSFGHCSDATRELLFYLAPGGCTIAGLLALEDGRVRSTIARGIQVATERASELGQVAKK